MATVDDVLALAGFLAEFFSKSDWGETLKLDPIKVFNYLRTGIGSGSVVYVIALDGRDIVGVCSYHTFDVFDKPIAVMDETYVIRKLRFTDLGRRLIGLVIELARADGCGVLNLPICSGMAEQNGLMNMVGHHFGAKPVGMIFRKVL